MKRLDVIALCVLLLQGCAEVEKEKRVERGPLLNSSDRSQVVEGGVRADVDVSWPKLSLALTGYDVCRTLHVDEYAEEHTTETTSKAAGPALSVGVIGTAVGVGLLAFSPLFSNAPNTHVLDGSGHYGATSRSQAIGWGIVGVSVGVPALVVGIIGMVQSGSVTETKKVEQISGQEDKVCHPKPVDGALLLKPDQGPPTEVTVTAGVATIDASALKSLSIDRLEMFGKKVELEDAGRRLLDAFAGCAVLERQPVASVEALNTTDLFSRAERARACRRVRPEAQTVSQQLETELARRRQGADEQGGLGVKVQSYDGAMMAYAPKLKLTPGSPDLAALAKPEAITNQAALIEGMIEGGLTPNIVVIQLGEQPAYLFIPTEHPWGGEFGPGTRVEGVAMVAGLQTVGDRTLPLLRAVWLRPAIGR